MQVVNLVNCYQYRQKLCAKFWQNYSALDNSSRTPFFSQSSCSGPQYWSGTPNHSESPGPMFMFTWLKKIYLKIKSTSNQPETNSKSARSIFVVFVVVDAHRCKVVVLLVTWGASHRNLTINNHWHFFTWFKSSSSSHHRHNYKRIIYFPETDHTQLIVSEPESTYRASLASRILIDLGRQKSNLRMTNKRKFFFCVSRLWEEKMTTIMIIHFVTPVNFKNMKNEWRRENLREGSLFQTIMVTCFDNTLFFI